MGVHVSMYSYTTSMPLHYHAVHTDCNATARSPPPHSQGKSCMVHGDDGWDMTAVVVTLAQVMLDPNCRTRPGYVA